MQLSDALAALGLDTHPGAEALRRAYLRALKKHKPERDPEGFQRVREAYEWLDARPWLAGGGERLSAPRAASAGEADECLAAVPQGEAIPPADIAPRIDTHADAPELAREQGPLLEPPPGDEPDHDIARAVNEAPDADARIAVLERAIETRPDNPWWWDQLALDLYDAGREPEAIATLRRGISRGHGSLIDQLLERHPSALDDDELAQLRRDPGLRDLAVARALVARGMTDEARACALAGLRRDCEELHGRPERWVDTVLQLIEASEPAAARTVWDALSAALRAQQRETALMHHDRISYELTRELLALPASIPADLRAAIARGVREGDPANAENEVDAIASAKSRRERERMRRVLAEHAPTLARALGDAVSYVPPAEPAPTRVPVWLLVPVVLMLMRFFTSSLHESPSDRSDRIVESLVASAREDGRARPVTIATLRTTIAANACRALPASCDRLYAWEEAIARGDCRAATRELAALEGAGTVFSRYSVDHHEDEARPPDPRSPQIAALRTVHDAVCPPMSSGGAP